MSSLTLKRAETRRLTLYPTCNTGSVGLVSRFGKFYKATDPGLVNVNICTESLRVVDVKIQISAIGRQTVITRDKISLQIRGEKSQATVMQVLLTSRR